ncbi:unnamed protein product [Dracunculus medinensis]|uniref:Reverse transcriptase domain-containing protein n=1 Tax=Dracunculus medinensis TaxID=318479 RepID=A0A0N4UIK3_DRAME|nr:unnamed protein product [Dracunculus medinensis]
MRRLYRCDIIGKYGIGDQCANGKYIRYAEYELYLLPTSQKTSNHETISEMVRDSNGVPVKNRLIRWKEFFEAKHNQEAPSVAPDISDDDCSKAILLPILKKGDSPNQAGFTPRHGFADQIFMLRRIDWVMDIACRYSMDVQINPEHRIIDLEYADDVVFFAESEMGQSRPGLIR